MRFRLAVLLVALVGCRPTATVLSPVDFRRSAAGGDWELVELQGQPAGCNRYFGGYSLDDDEPVLRFSAIGMTRMACSQGMELERHSP